MNNTSSTAVMEQNSVILLVNMKKCHIEGISCGHPHMKKKTTEEEPQQIYKLVVWYFNSVENENLCCKSTVTELVL
jgi:hypothetical protein